MKKIISPTIRNIIILILPFAFMVVINEFTDIEKHNHEYLHIKTRNPGNRNLDHCTWACHDNTDWCREHHVKLPLKLITITDIPYEGFIQKLRKGNKLYKGDYQINNILYLVILIPFAIWYFIISGLKIQDNILTYKNNNKL